MIKTYNNETSQLFDVIDETGVTKSMLRFCMQNHFSITNPMITNCLCYYQIEECSKNVVLSNIIFGLFNGHQVIYKDSLSALRKEVTLSLSFRIAKAGYNMESYVLIRKGKK